MVSQARLHLVGLTLLLLLGGICRNSPNSLQLYGQIHGLPCVCRTQLLCSSGAVQVSLLPCWAGQVSAQSCSWHWMEVTGIWWSFFAQICAVPNLLGTTCLLFLLHFKNISTGEGDEQQKANPKHLKISGSLENHETGFGVSLCIV